MTTTPTPPHQPRQKLLLFCVLAAIFAFTGLLIWNVSDGSRPDTQVSEDGRTVLVNPWQIPGYKRGIVAKIWVDPQTRCHYLITGGSYSWNLVPRLEAGSSHIMCDRPVPTEAQ